MAEKCAIVYARVSTVEQGEKGISLSDQIETCREWARKNGFQIVREYAEIASGGKSDRQKFLAAVAAAQHFVSKGYETIIVSTRADRFSRGPIWDALPLYSEAAEQGWRLHALDLPELDPTSTMGEFGVTMLHAVARLERRQASDRTKRTLAHKKRQGHRLGRPSPWANPDGSVRRDWHDVMLVMGSLRENGLPWKEVADTMDRKWGDHLGVKFTAEYCRTFFNRHKWRIDKGAWRDENPRGGF